jgi:hypothetical protein
MGREDTVQSTPQAGDIVIHRQIHSPAVYVLSVLDEPHQIMCLTYEGALDRAIGFARREHLDAWYTIDEQTFERVAENRSVRS